MDNRFYRNVAEVMPELLAKPTPKKIRDCDGEIIPIISVICEGSEW